jgi:hypothetical protein
MKKILFLLVCCLWLIPCFAQDFRCTVSVNADQIQLTDKSIFKKLENSIREFMNNRKWSADKVQDNERIDCTITIVVSEFAQPGSFKATAQIQSRRTVYGSNYNSQVFNFSDENWFFNYNEFQPLEYFDGQNLSNLTSLLAYYSYVILGLDYDTFSPEGGKPYFSKAQNIVNLCQNSNEPGWKANENKSTRNRFALIDNIFNPRFQPLRKVYYNYHRLGLDMMSKNVEEARATIVKTLQEVQKVYKLAPNSIFLKTFFDAKSDEMVNIFKGLPTNAEKQKVIDILSQIDFANANKYQKIL